jgi:predicted peptidase
MRSLLFAFLLPMTLMATMPEKYEKLATGKFEAAVFELKDSKLNYRIRIPEQAKSQKLPFVVFLHGAGERGDDNQRQLKHNPFTLAPQGTFENNPCIAIAPQCPQDQWWSGNNLKLVLELIDEISDQLPIDEDRIYITGLSMGGMGTWALLEMEPELFAAAIPICGGGNPQAAKKFKKVPIWAFHGGADPTVPPEKSREMVAALKNEGSEIKYTEYPGVEHNSWTQTYKNPEVWEWLFTRKK